MEAKRKTPVWVVHDVYDEEVIGVFSHETYAENYVSQNEKDYDYNHLYVTKHYIDDELHDK